MRQIITLHQLLHAMDGGEKRHFRSYQAAMTKQNGQVNQLYDLLLSVSPEQLDVQDLLARHPELQKNLPTLTRRLMEAVNSALELQHRGKSMESRLHHELEIIAILYQKKQWELANWKLKKEKKNALHFGYFLQFISLLKWERMILLERFPHKSIDQLQSIRHEEKQAQRMLSQQSELNHMNHLARHLIRQRKQSGDASHQFQLRDIAANPIVATGLNSDDFLSFSYASNIQGIHLIAINDNQAAIEIYRQAFSKWKNELTWIREQPQLFLALFSNYQIALVHGQDDVKELEGCLRFIQKVRLKAPTVQLIFQNISYQGEIMLFMNQGNFEAAITLYEEIANWLEQSKKNLSGSIQLTFRYNAAIVCFMMEDFSRMRLILNEIIDFSGKSAREDITDLARLLIVVAWIELGDLEYAEALLRNAYQYFLRNRYTAFYRLSVELLRKLILQEGERKALFGDYIHDVNTHLVETGKSDFGIMELRVWANGRKRGVSLRTVFQEFIS